MSKNYSNGNIYTLAQNRTHNYSLEHLKAEISGTGTSIIDNPALLKRANKKVITNALTLALVDVAKSNGEFDLVKKYWNTYHCQNELTGYDQRVHGKYCKNRWCATCAGIRKADLLNTYYPLLIKWKEPHLLTLTIKSVKAEQLADKISEMISKFNTLKDRCNKRHSRGKGMKLIGIKSLECNFNASKKWYNPHYHIIVPNRPMALYIKQEWKKEWNKNGNYQVSERGQDIREITNVEKGLVEVIKYGAKMLSDADPTHKRKRKRGDLDGLSIYANALHTIYKAMSHHRLYGSFGFKLSNKEKTTTNVKLVNDFQTWKYQHKYMDWVNTSTGKRLTEYDIDSKLEQLLNTCIDTELV